MALTITVEEYVEHGETYRETKYSGGVRVQRTSLGQWKPDYSYNTVNPAVYKDGTTLPLDPVGWPNGDSTPRDWNDTPTGKTNAAGKPMLADGAGTALGRQPGQRGITHNLAFEVETAPVAGASPGSIETQLAAYRVSIVNGMREGAALYGATFNETDAPVVKRIAELMTAKREALIADAKKRAEAKAAKTAEPTATNGAAPVAKPAANPVPATNAQIAAQIAAAGASPVTKVGR